MDWEERNRYTCYNRTNLLAWQDAKILDGYKITCKPGACAYCKFYEGDHKFSEKSVLPPFNGNGQCACEKGCGCHLDYKWRYGKDKYDGITGQSLHPDCRWRDIFSGLENFLRQKGLSRKLKKEDIVWNGDSYISAQKKTGMLEDVNDYNIENFLTGGHTFVNYQTVKNIDGDADHNTFGWWLNEAKNKAKEIIKFKKINNIVGSGIEDVGGVGWAQSGNNNLILDITETTAEFAKRVAPNKDFYLKSKTYCAFGDNNPITINGVQLGDRRYYGYIWKGDYFRWDDPGNFLYGYLGFHVGFSLAYLKTLAQLFSLATKSSWDDQRDEETLEKGFNYAKSE